MQWVLLTLPALCQTWATHHRVAGRGHPRPHQKPCGDAPMSVKKYTYSLRLIRADYTYTVEQIADLFGVDIATVRRWISKEGLARIPKTRPHLIHSSALLTFLVKKKSARKQPCQPDQAYCFTCKAPRAPAIGTGTTPPQTERERPFPSPLRHLRRGYGQGHRRGCVGAKSSFGRIHHSCHKTP